MSTTKKRTIAVDPVSLSKSWLDDGQEDSSSSSSSSLQNEPDPVANREAKDRQLRMASISPIRVTPETSENDELQHRVDEMERTLVVPRPLSANRSAADTLLQGLFDFADLMIIVNIWGVTDEVTTHSPDHEIERILLYREFLNRYEDWNQLLQHAIKTRVALVMSGVRERLGPENADHAIYTLFPALKIGKIVAKRVFKRQMSVDIGRVPSHMQRMQVVNESMEGHVTDIWTSTRHLAKDLQMQSQPVMGANNRPIIVKDERGVEKILTEKRDPTVKLVKLKGIMFFPQPVDIDPYALVNTTQDLDEDEQLRRAAAELAGTAKPLGAGLPEPFQVLFPSVKGQPDPKRQIIGLHNFIHLIEHIEQELSHILQSHPEDPNQSFSEVRKTIYGEKNSAVTDVMKLVKKGAFATVVVTFRNVLQTNLDMISCDACKIMTHIQCSCCPTCGITLRNCIGSTKCAADALRVHNKKMHSAEPVKKKQKPL